MNPIGNKAIATLRPPSSYTTRLQASLEQATAFARTYPNNTKLWSMVRVALDQLLYGEWRAGRLMGQRSDQAYLVRCDATTMTQSDVANGRLVAIVGVAPLKPAEFVVLTIVQQSAT